MRVKPLFNVISTSSIELVWVTYGTKDVAVLHIRFGLPSRSFESTLHHLMSAFVLRLRRDSLR